MSLKQETRNTSDFQKIYALSLSVAKLVDKSIEVFRKRFKNNG